MERSIDDKGVEQPHDLSGVFGGVEPERKPEVPDEWQESATGDPAFFIKPSDGE